MTDEIFEKAVEIRERINTIIDLQSVLNNSKDNGCGDKYLAAIDTKHSKGFIVDECEILNRIKVPENIMKRFEAVLWDELEKTENEYEAL